MEEQLGGFCLGVKAHAGHNRLGVNRGVLVRQEPCVGLQGALVAFILTEDGRCWQRELQHITINGILQHHSQTLLVAACTAVAVARASNVLGATHATVGLLVSHTHIRRFAICGRTVRGRNLVAVVRCCIEYAADLGGSQYDHDIKVALLNVGDLFAASHQTKHTTLCADALDVVTCAT